MATGESKNQKVKVVTQIYLDANISKTVEDRGSVTMGHQYRRNCIIWTFRTNQL